MIDLGLTDLWPPLKVGVGTNHLRHRLQRETALGLDRLQSLEILKVAIGKRVIGQWPQALRRLQLWGIRRQQVAVHPGGELYLWAHMPARPVAHQEDLLALPGAHGWANSARATVQAMRETVGSSSQNVRPDGGCTKAYR
jgi:hypothetical protein